MKYKKIVSTVLACALAVTTAFSVNMASVKAEAKPTTPEANTLLGSYDFNPAEGSTDGTLDENVKMVNSGSGTEGSIPAAYTGQAVYGEGRTGQSGDKAIQLGQYGLELPQKNIGTNYTVSMWAKPTSDTINNFSPLLFLGYYKPEKWIGVAAQWHDVDKGAKYTNNCILWGINSGLGNGEGKVPEPTFEVKQDEWTMITVSQTGKEVSIYRNGELVNTVTITNDVLDGQNQGIYIGANFWDKEFPALVDDINVYNTALNGAQVRYLYDGKTEAEVFEAAKDNIQVQDTLTVKVGGVKQKIQVTGIPSSVVNAEITYTSADSEKLEVNQTTGELTAKAASNTPIAVTTKVKVGTAEVTKTTNVTVEAASEVANYEAVVDYDFAADKVSSDSLADASGKNNSAKIHGTSGTDYEFIQEDGQNVMVLKSNNAYLDLPTSIMESLTDKEKFTIETKFAKSKDCGTNAWLFCLGSKVKAKGTNYLFLSPNFGGQLRSGIKNSDADKGEKLFSTLRRPTIDKYYTVSMVFDRGTIRLYLNGIKVQDGNKDALESDYSIMDDVVIPGTENNILGYIGKSCYSADKNYQGKIASFRIYNGAMSEDDVLAKFDAVFKDSFNEAVTEEKALGNNASKEAVRYNLSLPTTYEDLPIVWTSTDEAVISKEGEVTCPAQATEVTLTATVTSDSLEATKEITVTVVPMDNTELNAQLADANAKCQDTNYTERSRNNLKKMIDNAGTVKNQTEADNLATMIKNAISKLESSELFKNPFTSINESKVAAETTLTSGQSADVFKDLIPADIKNMVTVSYVSSNPTVAAVDSSTGVVTAGTLGYARVTAVVKAKYDNFEVEYQTLVKVNIDMNGVTAKADADTLAKGGKTKITVNMASISNLSPTVSYRATGAVSVDKSGNVSGKSAGTGKVYVKVTAGGKSVTRTVTIKVGDITGKSSVKVKKSITLKVSGITGKVKWSVDKSKFAKISQKGKLTAKKKGKVTVTAKVGKITMKKKITIKK